MQPVNSKLLVKHMLTGGAVALVLIGLFVLPVHGDAEWGNLWKIRPMVVVPIAGAVGGACLYFLRRFAPSAGWKVVATIVGIFVYIIDIWMGTILGLDGTMWN